jgi:hypothetical protein
MTQKANLGKKGGANIPSSPACGQWETLLVDALDGVLRPEDEATFSNHMATCPECTELFEQARRGREWLEFLAPEPEVPAYLLDKILVGTGHAKSDKGIFAPSGLVPAGVPAAALGTTVNLIQMQPAWQRPGFVASLRRFAEPRLLMTAAMAFFSIALTLSLTGVRISVIKMADLRPASVRSALEKRIMTASTPIVRYYDHLRFVYELESRVKEMRRSTQGEGEQQKNQTPGTDNGQPTGESHKKDGGSEIHPNDAPQQTVNPPVPLWGGDALEADSEETPGPKSALRSEPVLRTNGIRLLQPSIVEVAVTELDEQAKSFGGNTQVLGSRSAKSVETSVLAMPDRSTTCTA